MEFRSIADMALSVTTQLHRFPDDLDAIVGIPRSGMLPATILALALNKPLLDMDSLIAGIDPKTGATRGQSAVDFGSLRHVLVIDDSIRTGGSISKAREAARDLEFRCTFAAVYGVGNVASADIVLETVPEPRAFEWNILHHPGFLSRMCLDIDGILCADPSNAQNDDGAHYRAFLASPPRRFLPSGKVRAVVSSRLEKYRPETERWLRSAGIEFDELFLLDLDSAEQRRKLGVHAQFKAEVYKSIDANLFVESERWQAEQIARISGKQVLLMGDNQPRLIKGSPLSPQGFYWRLRQSSKLGWLKRFLNGRSLSF